MFLHERERGFGDLVSINFHFRNLDKHLWLDK